MYYDLIVLEIEILISQCYSCNDAIIETLQSTMQMQHIDCDGCLISAAILGNCFDVEEVVVANVDALSMKTL